MKMEHAQKASYQGTVKDAPEGVISAPQALEEIRGAEGCGLRLYHYYQYLRIDEQLLRKIKHVPWSRSGSETWCVLGIVAVFVSGCVSGVGLGVC